MALVVPGGGGLSARCAASDSFDVALKVHKPGMWMYMCMFPYHMQLGMMGMIMAGEQSMEMDSEMSPAHTMH